MKKYLFILSFFAATVSFAQFKDDQSKHIDIRNGILNDNPMGSLFNFIDPSNFSMGHTFGMSYSTFGKNGMALGVYTNRIAYAFSEQFDIEVNTSFVNSPYNTLGDSFTKSINGVYIDNARINYNPSDKFNISLQYSNSPLGYNNRYYSRGFSPFSHYWYD